MTEEVTQEVLSFDTLEIMEMIPHRFPFLLVDRITECVPGKYAKGIPISFNDTECDSEQVKIFIAGAQEQDGMLVTSGGRVLAVCSHGDTFEQAHKQAYQALQSIHFDGMFYRKDIGLPGAADSI